MIQRKRFFWLFSIYRAWTPATEAGKNTLSIDHPINGVLLAFLAETGSSKKTRTNNRGKGGPDRVERLKSRETERNTLRRGREKRVETKGGDQRNVHSRFITRKSIGGVCCITARPQLAQTGKVWLPRRL